MSKFILENDKFIVEIDKRPPNKMFNNGWLCYGKNTKRLVPFPIKGFNTKYKSCIETDNAVFFYVGRGSNKFKDHIYKCTYTVKQVNDIELTNYKVDKRRNIGNGKTHNDSINLVGTEIRLSLKQIHKFMSKEYTVKTTRNGGKDKYIPCIISIRNGQIVIDYDTNAKPKNRKRHEDWQKLSKEERRVIKTEKRKLKNESSYKVKAQCESIIDYI